jgi:3'-phosphoadenosine 5'-phosphosulfate sulfotransferase (PAPS reductase)/FAD synthetase
MKKIYDLFVSGGKDSVVAATIAFEEARQQGVEARVVFIDESKAFKIPEHLIPYKPIDYVKKFSEWLGVELIVLEPDFDYWEGVKRWGYPMYIINRWCMEKLKRKPLEEFLYKEVKQGYRPVWVFGYRREESWLRKKIYTQKKMFWTLGGIQVENYYPILDWTERQVDEFIRKREIPENPLWRLGFSFECLCMAGTSRKKLDKMITMFPDLFKYLAEKDKEVQQARKRKDHLYVAPLEDIKEPLHIYVEKKLREPKITDYIKKNS